MKKIFLTLAVAGLFSLGTVNVFAQEEAAPQTQTESATVANPETDVPGQPMHQMIKEKFLDGGAAWMAPILLCLVLGLAIAIERIIYLTLSTTNAKKLIARVEDALKTGGVEAAMEVCRNTRGPVASIFYQGLSHYDDGLDVVEKSVVSSGSVQNSLMENGLTWISLFISISPMIGFLGTVVGMILAFDSIQALGDVSPIAVAGGIKVALLTTLAGLVAAIILQLFYNYLLSKIDTLVMTMEDSSISLIDLLIQYNKDKK